MPANPVAARVIEAGAVGITIEDGTAPVDLTCRKIAAARASADRLGIDLFVNARCDVCLRGLAPAGARVAETLSRGVKYQEAGASGLFAPGVVDAGELRDLVAGSGMPPDVMARNGLPDGAGLEALGARRLGSGGDLAEALYGRLRDLACDFLRTGDCDPLAGGAMSCPDLKALMVKDQAAATGASGV